MARALIMALIERAKQDSSLEQILLSVATARTPRSDSIAAAVFETYGTEPNALKVGSRYIDEDHMILRIR